MDDFSKYYFQLTLMMCLTVENFCCCMSVEVGAKVISIVCTLMSAMVTVLYSSAALLLRVSQIKMYFYCAMSGAAGLQCLFGLLLCFGTFQKRPKLMWPWLMVSCFTGVSLLVVSTAGCVALILAGSLTQDVNLVISAYVIYSLFLLYCASVVNNRRLELMKENEESESARTLMQPSFVRPPSAFKYA